MNIIIMSLIKTLSTPVILKLVVGILRYLANKTDNKIDNKLVDDIEEILKGYK